MIINIMAVVWGCNCISVGKNDDYYLHGSRIGKTIYLNES